MNIEKLIIASILAEPENAGIACEMLTPEMFTGIEQLIFTKINDLNEQGFSPDIFILSNSLKGQVEATALMEIVA